jgi:hypothetical protein
MAVFRSVPFPVPEAQLLADLTGVSTDLNAVAEYCDRFLDLLDKDQLDGVVLGALCEAAIVRYVRTLATGVRSGVSMEMLEKLGEEHLAVHNYVKDARDKWVAHSVNSFELNDVSVWLTPPERGAIGPYAVTVRQHRVSYLSKPAITALKELVTELSALVKAKIDEEKSKVLAIAQQKPPDSFYEQQSEPIRLPGREHPGKSRSKQRQGNARN